MHRNNISPMLAHLGDQEDLNREGYIFEPKLDGIRALCFVNKTMRLITRNNIDLTHKYPEFDFRDAMNVKSAILDGEIIMFDPQGRPSFTVLQNRYREMNIVPATYVVFDILMINGKSLLHMPLHERKKILDVAFVPQPGLLERIIFTHDGHALWKVIKKKKMEGVMAKKYDGLYYPGYRTNEWIKVKTSQSLDAVIIGFTQQKREVSSLALALYDQGSLQYIGKVGTGFDQKIVLELYAKFQPIIRATPPCPTPLKNTVWIQPKYVAEIKYLEWTTAKRLRSPVFLQLRPDKKAKECTFDQ